jgi:hypothetical protein
MRQGSDERGRRAPRPSRRGGRRPFAAAFALAGILFHAFLPLLSMSMSGPAAASPFGGTLTICTALGAFTAPGTASGEASDETEPPSRSILLCPVCAAAHLAAFLPPPVPVHAPAATMRADWNAPETDGPARRVGGYDSLPRAPPASV